MTNSVFDEREKPSHTNQFDKRRKSATVSRLLKHPHKSALRLAGQSTGSTHSRMISLGDGVTTTLDNTRRQTSNTHVTTEPRTTPLRRRTTEKPSCQNAANNYY